jgi:type II secretory pathway component PulJ
MSLGSHGGQRWAIAGFTVSEVLASIIVFSAVGAAVAAVAVSTFNSTGFQSRIMDAQLDVASAMALMQDDLRAVGYVTDNMNQAIFQGLVTGTSKDRVTFVGDVNADDVSERITYYLDGGRLLRTQDIWNGVNAWLEGSPQPVAAGVTAFTLKFYLVDPCTAAISQQSAAQVLGTETTSLIAISLTGSGTYKGKTVIRRVSSGVASRQENVRPACT